MPQAVCHGIRRRQDCGTCQPPSSGLSTFSGFHVLLEAVLFCERAVKLVIATLRRPTQSLHKFVQALITFLTLHDLCSFPRICPYELEPNIVLAVYMLLVVHLRCKRHQAPLLLQPHSASVTIR